MPNKNKNIIFICQATDSYLKVVKCISTGSLKREFLGLELAPIASDIDDKSLFDEIKQAFKKLGYANNPVVLALPRQAATCRYLKIPSQLPEEIEKIVNLQASHYLPYHAEELITAYQIIQIDNEGYAHINLIIAHKNIVNRYVKIFKELKSAKINIVLSSFGIFNLCNYVMQRESSPFLVIDIDTQQVEIAAGLQGKVIFSRVFKLGSDNNWENLFIDEVKKTKDAYVKEVSREMPSRVIIVGTGSLAHKCLEILNRQGNSNAEILHYTDKIKAPQSLLNRILNSEVSFSSLIGLGLKEMPESLNLIPTDIKEEVRDISQKKEYSRIILFVVLIALVWAGIAFKNFDNKYKNLQQLKAQLDKVKKEASGLEAIEKRFAILESQALKRQSCLDILYALHKLLPAQISLANFSYEENDQIALRGQAQELNAVFTLVSDLESSAVFKNFNIKIRYATQRKTQQGETIVFEIVCANK